MAGTGELTSRRLLVLFEGLPDNCKTKVELGAHPWAVGERLALITANLTHSLYAVAVNVHRDRDEMPEPYTFTPIPEPELVLSPEQQAERERAQAAAAGAAQRDRMAAFVHHDMGIGLLTGKTTMAELSARIQLQMEGRI